MFHAKGIKSYVFLNFYLKIYYLKIEIKMEKVEFLKKKQTTILNHIKHYLEQK